MQKSRQNAKIDLQVVDFMKINQYIFSMLEKIDIHIADHCNLNCRSCTHFSPLAEKFLLDIDDFKKDIERISFLTKGEIGSIFLLGGEPLLHPQIADFFPVARKFFPNSKIVIITNAILLETKDDDFWKSCKEFDIQLWVSKYYDLKINFAKNEQKAREFGVFYGYTSTKKDDADNKSWAKYKLDIEGKQDWINSFEHCPLKNCVTLKKGRLYTCCTMAHIEHFNKFFKTNLELSEYDSVDIYKIQSMKAIEDTMVKPVPFCRYCKTTEFEMLTWAQSEKKIDEWT